MRKDKLLELVHTRMVKGRPSSETMTEFHPAVIEQLIVPIFDYILYEEYIRVRKRGNFRVFDSLTKPYVVSVAKDESRDEYYIDIPAGYSSVPNTIAIRRISYTKDKSSTVSLISQDSIVNIENSAVGRVSDKLNGYIESSKVWLHRYDPDIHPTELLMNIVVNFDEYEDSDNIPTPPSAQGTIYDLIISKLFPEQNIPPDQINDEA